MDLISLQMEKSKADHQQGRMEKFVEGVRENAVCKFQEIVGFKTFFWKSVFSELFRA